MKKLLLSLLVCLAFCSPLAAQSPSVPSATETQQSTPSDYSEMDVTQLLSILSQDLEAWNSSSISQEQALKKAYDLLKKTSDELQAVKIATSEIRRLYPQLETQLTGLQEQKNNLQKNNSVLKIVSSVSLFAAASALGYSIGGATGAAIGMGASVAASIGISLFL